MKGSLSVVIPGYNTPEAWWRRSVASVLAALGDGDEVIVVDDGSARDAPQPSWFGDARVRVLRLPRNGGQSVARNAGIEAARGEWIAFADSDDEVVPEAYREILFTTRIRCRWSRRCIRGWRLRSRVRRGTSRRR